jgi:hypothetical protein
VTPGKILLRGLIAIALLCDLASAQAQDGEKRAPLAPATEETLKERLSDKASDEQRVDNCKVPLDRRGATPRPEGCGAGAKSTLPPYPAR